MLTLVARISLDILAVIVNGVIQDTVDLCMASRSFTFWFAAKELDPYGFVVDFSSLRSGTTTQCNQFDHTFLANADDPLLSQWQSLNDQGAIDLRV